MQYRPRQSRICRQRLRPSSTSALIRSLGVSRRLTLCRSCRCSVDELALLRWLKARPSSGHAPSPPDSDTLQAQTQLDSGEFIIRKLAPVNCTTRSISGQGRYARLGAAIPETRHQKIFSLPFFGLDDFLAFEWYELLARSRIPQVSLGVKQSLAVAIEVH
jgi:hypothetical protein